MKDINILKQVREMNRLVDEDRILVKDLLALVAEGLNPVVVEVWYEYAKQAKLNSTTIHSLLIKDIEQASYKPSLFKSLLKKIGL